MIDWAKVIECILTILIQKVALSHLICATIIVALQNRSISGENTLAFQLNDHCQDIKVCKQALILHAWERMLISHALL